MPKTPLKKSPSYFKTPEKSSGELATELPFSHTVGQSHWHTGAESARDTIRKIRRQTRKALVKEGAKQVKKEILKKLEAAPRRKPFGTPCEAKTQWQRLIENRANEHGEGGGDSDVGHLIFRKF